MKDGLYEALADWQHPLGLATRVCLAVLIVTLAPSVVSGMVTAALALIGLDYLIAILDNNDMAS